MPQGNGGGRGEARSLWRARNGRVIHCLHAASQTRRSTRAWAADQFRAQHSRSSTVFIAIESGLAKLVQRSEFNSCGECATSATTYTGVSMRRLNELPRMDADSKSSILGAAAAGAVAGKRVAQNIEEKGHPFSQCEVKPLNLWQRMCEHHDRHRGFIAWICWPRHRSRWRDGVRRCGSQRDSLGLA